MALSGLEQVAMGPGEAEEDEKRAASKRLVWHLILKSSSLPGGLAVQIEPLEQSFRGRWSKGRKVALKRLSRDRKSVPYLTLQDHRVCDSLEENKYYTPFGVGSTYDFDLSRALEALPGTPCSSGATTPRRGWRSWRRSRAWRLPARTRESACGSFPGSPGDSWSLFEESRFRLRLVRPGSTTWTSPSSSAARDAFSAGRLPASPRALSRLLLSWKSAPTWRAW
jgi:hypothetical protein